MDTQTCLLQRRSVRQYRPDPIPDDILQEIMACALAAPSAVNQQHWHFVVVRSPEGMEKLRAIMSKVPEAFLPVLEKRFGRNPQVIESTLRFLSTLGGAPVCVLAFFLRDDYPDRDGAMQSVSAAIENLLLAAWEKGLGSCWMSAPQRMGFGGEFQREFAPQAGEFVAAVTLGYPKAVPSMPPRREGRVVYI